MRTCVNCSLIVLDCFDERSVGRFARAQRVAIRHGALVRAVAETFAEGERLFFGIEDLRLGEVEHIVGVKIFFEAVNIIVNEEIDGERVGDNVNFYWHKEQILSCFVYAKIQKICDIIAMEKQFIYLKHSDFVGIE